MALADAMQCVKLAPRWGKGYARQGAALVGLGRPDDALPVFAAGLEVRLAHSCHFYPTRSHLPQTQRIARCEVVQNPVCKVRRRPLLPAL